jgi:hypothetical protein
MYISYDLGKALQRDRLNRAMSQFEARRHVAIPEVPADLNSEEADIIELVFTSHCETDRIGA